ncbi:ABC transporter permease [Oricola cellulosilytica]|uniref:ABC transporter permease n=2 Tax=Oricola cellulosilytica TaxID=1429082 RepID=A0A4R0P5T6_9HYPH|nr:ABC transporter permease [Oricola cellulosilytica]
MANAVHTEKNTPEIDALPLGRTVAKPRLETRQNAGLTEVIFEGVWATYSVGSIDQQMRLLENKLSGERLRIEMSDISYLDTAGAWMIYRLLRSAKVRGIEASIDGMRTSHKVLLEAIARAMEDIDEDDSNGTRASILNRMLSTIGLAVYGFRNDLQMGLHILGAAVRGSQMKLGHGSGLSIPAVVNQIDRTGVTAIPIILLMSTIIGAIIAQQGAFQLRYFGAEIFVVDLVGILVLREIGVLLTAIMIAGRSGSAITAEIGSMKMREEVDALTVIGLNPVGVLVFPRLVALVIALPLLTFIANLAALAGAMFVAQTYSGISPDAFITRVRDAVDLSTIYAGLIKAPFMAIIIGIIASVEGMKVGGSAESLGARVTASVVKSIFIVIVVDGAFAMFFAAIDF